MKAAFAIIAALALPIPMAQAAQAHIRDCTKKEYQSADQTIGWNSEDHNLFTVPELTYDRPVTKALGIQVVFVVGTAGAIQCMGNPDWTYAGRYIWTATTEVLSLITSKN